MIIRSRSRVSETISMLPGTLFISFPPKKRVTSLDHGAATSDRRSGPSQLAPGRMGEAIHHEQNGKAFLVEGGSSQATFC